MTEPTSASGRACPCQIGENSERYLALERYTIMRCPVCGVAWTAPRPGTVDYAHNDFHSCALGLAEEPATRDRLPREWRKSLDTMVAMLRRHLAPGARVYEVGCGQGLFLEALRAAGFAVSGIEPSQRASQVARDRGLVVETGFFGSGNHSQRADCVVFSQVFEHLGEPHRTLADAAALVNDGYAMFFQTNYRGLIPRITRKKWAWIPEEHFWHFTPASLSQWVACHGFRPVALRYVSLVQSNWKSKLLEFAAACLPHAHDGFIALYRRTDQTRLVDRASCCS